MPDKGKAQLRFDGRKSREFSVIGYMAMQDKAQPNYVYTALYGSLLALNKSRFDEGQRRQRHRLRKGAVCWDSHSWHHPCQACFVGLD